MIELSIGLFIAGLLFLFFGKLKDAINDIIGFALVIAGYVILLVNYYEILPAV